MRRSFSTLRIVVVALAAFSFLFSQSAAQAQTDFFGEPATILICLKGSIPFVWVRSSPSSYAGVVGTLYPADYAKLVKAEGGATFDGTQWWYSVYAFPSTFRIFRGWIEANSAAGVENGCERQPPYLPPHPRLNGTLCLKPGVPFIWERPAPSSFAPAMFTIHASQRCTGPGQFPLFESRDVYYFDGIQWWINVGHPPRSWSSRSWVEVNSLVAMP